MLIVIKVYGDVLIKIIIKSQLKIFTVTLITVSQFTVKLESKQQLVNRTLLSS